MPSLVFLETIIIIIIVYPLNSSSDKPWVAEACDNYCFCSWRRLFEAQHGWLCAFYTLAPIVVVDMWVTNTYRTLITAKVVHMSLYRQRVLGIQLIVHPSYWTWNLIHKTILSTFLKYLPLKASLILLGFTLLYFTGFFFFFTNWRFVATLYRVSLLVLFSQQPLITLCLCYIW